MAYRGHGVVPSHVTRLKTLVGSGCRWEDNIKIDLQEVGWGGLDWTGLAEDRDRWQALVNAVMSIRVS
jgi:hypothetical protein